PAALPIVTLVLPSGNSGETAESDSEASETSAPSLMAPLAGQPAVAQSTVRFANTQTGGQSFPSATADIKNNSTVNLESATNTQENADPLSPETPALSSASTRI